MGLKEAQREMLQIIVMDTSEVFGKRRARDREQQIKHWTFCHYPNYFWNKSTVCLWDKSLLRWKNLL